MRCRHETDLLGATYAELARHVRELDEMYGSATERRFAAMGPADQLASALSEEQKLPLPDLAKWAAAAVQGD